MTVKTRKPKAPKEQKKTRNVKKDTANIITDCLNAFVHATVQVAYVYVQGDLTEAQMLKKIRAAEKDVAKAKMIISKMRVSIWRDEMLKQLDTHERTLEEKWNLIVEEDDTDDS